MSNTDTIYTNFNLLQVKNYLENVSSCISSANELLIVKCNKSDYPSINSILLVYSKIIGVDYDKFKVFDTIDITTDEHSSFLWKNEILNSYINFPSDEISITIDLSKYKKMTPIEVNRNVSEYHFIYEDEYYFFLIHGILLS